MNYWDLKVDELAGEKPKRIRRRGNIPPEELIEIIEKDLAKGKNSYKYYEFKQVIPKPTPKQRANALFLELNINQVLKKIGVK